jgi:PAS domain S-box-containing protein
MSEGIFSKVKESICEFLSGESGLPLMVINEDKVFFLNEKMQNLLGISKEIKLPLQIDKIIDRQIHPYLYSEIIDLISRDQVNSGICLKSDLKGITLDLYTLHSGNKSYKIIISSGSNLQNSSENNSGQEPSGLFPFIMADIDLDGKMINCNQHFRRILEIPMNINCEGISLYDFVSTASKPLLESLLNNFSHFSDTESIELKLKKQNGNVFHASMYFIPFYDKGSIKGLRCVFVDISETKRIENKYRHNQQRLRKIIDLVPHMIYLKDFNGKILLSNKACAEFYQTNPQNLVYENISRFHEDQKELERIMAEDREVIENLQVRQWDNLILTGKDNEKKTFRTTKVPYQDNASSEVLSLGISVDITEQRKAEIEKEEANHKYRLLVDKGNDGILIITDNKIVFANKQAARMAGKSVEEIIGYPLSSFIPKNQLHKTLEDYKYNILNRNTDDYYSLKIEKPDAGFIYLEAKISSINYEGKRSRLVFVRDITKRRLAEIQGERDRNLLEQAQKIAHIGSWEWDILSNRLYCSDEIYKILDIEKKKGESLQIEQIATYISTLDKKRIYKGFINSTESGLKYETEFAITSKNGNRRIVHSHSMAFKDASGNLNSIIGTWHDITERIRIEQMLKEAKLKAEESDRLKSAFLANMSHEIRTPMNAVLGFANLLKREDIDEKTRIEYIDHILQSGEGLVKLINDIVDISKIESNQLKIDKVPVRLNEILEQIFNRYEELLLLKNQSNIILSYETALPDPDFSIITDPYRLQQILSNLLNNAIKFAPAGEIKFGYCIANSELQFYVQDQGIGIPEEKKEEIFKRFGKLEDPERMNKSGTGLGLSISKSLLELLGGRIWLDYNYAKGARFCFTLPLELDKRQTSKKTEKKPDGGQEIKLQEKTILIAEDEILNYKLLENLIKKTGAKVLWAKNGLDAVQMALENKVDLVFMDIKMPDMNGYEATKHIKRIDPDIPIIAQTAFAFANERSYILQSGCDMYMTKPIDQRELYKALKLFLT